MAVGAPPVEALTAQGVAHSHRLRLILGLLPHSPTTASVHSDRCCAPPSRWNALLGSTLSPLWVSSSALTRVVDPDLWVSQNATQPHR